MESKNNKLHIILASSSPRRQQMLKLIDVPFEIVISNYEENNAMKSWPSKIVMTHAKGKVGDVIPRVKSGVIIGADTLVYKDKRIYGKPKDMTDAYRMMKELQGKSHYVYTALALFDTDKKKWVIDYLRTKVSMRPLTKKEITRYFELINPLDKAGSYAIQEAGSIIIDKIEGCYYNVLGFPMAKLDEMMREIGYSLF
jgi:septum formation protein